MQSIDSKILITGGNRVYGSNALICSQIIVKNPVLKEDDRIKNVYLYFLHRYFNMAKYCSAKYIRPQIKICADVLGGKDFSGAKRYNDMAQNFFMIEKYKYLLFFDLFAALGYDEKILRSKDMTRITGVMTKELAISRGRSWVSCVINAFCGNQKAWEDIKKCPEANGFSEYIGYVQRNIEFIYEKPFDILVTATMSAGKSTLINALTGKCVSPSRNMACTSKIHNIIGKPFEDGFINKADYDIIMNAGKDELLCTHDKNKSKSIFVSAYYNGALGGKRIVLRDSPGVNSSCNTEHKLIAENAIKSKKYKLMLYVLNMGNTSSNDDRSHLEFVLQHIGKTPVIFILNRADILKPEEQEDLGAIIEDQRKYLEDVGFKNPVICPVSSKAGFLCKQLSDREPSRQEEMELISMKSRLKETDLSKYYRRMFPEITFEENGNETDDMLRECGIAYIEKIIGSFCR